MGRQSGAERDRALHLAGVASAMAEERFDRITRIASRLVDAPVSFVTVIDSRFTWTKSMAGAPIGPPVPNALSLCVIAIEEDGPVEVPDLRGDERYAMLPIVQLPGGPRFYTSYPLRVEGVIVGTLCVTDVAPRTLTDDQRQSLIELASWAEAELNNYELNAVVSRLADSERRLGIVIEGVPDAVVRVDSKNLAHLENVAARALFGEVEAEPVESLLLYDDLRGLAAPGSPRAWLTARRADGTTFPAEVGVNLLADDVFGPDELLLLVRDRSPEIAREVELDSERRFRELVLAGTTDAIIGVAPNGTVRHANAAAARLLGIAHQDLVGRPMREVLGGSPARMLGPFESTLTRPDGSLVTVEGTTAPLIVGETERGSVLTFRDITERREVELLKAEFLSVVSHELRTPLTSIKGSLEILATSLGDDLSAQQVRMLEMALGNSQRMALLVNDLLEIERLDAGSLPLEPELIDLRDLVLSTVDAATGAAGAGGVVLLHDAADSQAVLVHADQRRLGQALLNLVGNAIKFSAPAQQVALLLSTEGNEARVSVSDQGRGIPPHELDRVFERFHQVEPGDAVGPRGTGLGLPIARSIVECSGGTIEVTSLVGVGSTFTLVLPLSQ